MPSHSWPAVMSGSSPLMRGEPSARMVASRASPCAEIREAARAARSGRLLGEVVPGGDGSVVVRMVAVSARPSLTVHVKDGRYGRWMRSSRLVALLLHLQREGRATAGQLATLLEVSERTIYRDISALQAAGVPLWTETGPRGGVRLVEGWRTDLDGLTADEAGSLFLSGAPGAASDLGLGAVLVAAQTKVLSTLPPELRARAGRVRERFLLDAPDWFHHTPQVEHLATVADSVWSGRRLDVRYRRSDREVRRRLDPLGLVCKAGALVPGRGDGDGRHPHLPGRSHHGGVDPRRARRSTRRLRPRLVLGGVGRRLQPVDAPGPGAPAPRTARVRQPPLRRRRASRPRGRGRCLRSRRRRLAHRRARGRVRPGGRPPAGRPRRGGRGARSSGAADPARRGGPGDPRPQRCAGDGSRETRSPEDRHGNEGDP